MAKSRTVFSSCANKYCQITLSNDLLFLFHYLCSFSFVHSFFQVPFTIHQVNVSSVFELNLVSSLGKSFFPSFWKMICFLASFTIYLSVPFTPYTYSLHDATKVSSSIYYSRILCCILFIVIELFLLYLTYVFVTGKTVVQY